jgi:6-phosphogluconolactonase
MSIESGPHRDIISCKNAEDLAQRAADFMVTQLGGAGHTPLSVCLSGGSTPKRLYQRLTQAPWRSALPWNRLHWFFGDERLVPHDDPRSNFRMAQEALLAPASVPAAAVHPIPTDLATPDACAAAYQAEIERYYDAATLDPSRPIFDIMLLGLGPDGHTASLFPTKTAVDEKRRWVVATAAGLEPFVERVTLTLPAIAASRCVMFLVSGADKREALQRIAAGDDLPAARVVERTPTLWFVDEAALGEA